MSNKGKSLKLESEQFNQFISSISKVNDQAIITISDEGISSIVASDDRALFLWASIEGSFGDEAVLNLSSVQKLADLIKIANAKELDLEIKTNQIQYRGDSVKFDYHLLDDGILTAPKLTTKKIKSLEYEQEFTLPAKTIKQLLKDGCVLKDSNKVYITTEDEMLKWTFGDKSQSNLDSLSFDVDNYTGEDLDSPFIISTDNLRLMNLGLSEEVKFEINKLGIGKISFTNGDLKLIYIVSSLTN